MGTYGEIAVIGAGPAGLLTSFFIRKHKVTIFEEHSSPGKPEHCTGIVGKYTASYLTKILGSDLIDNLFYEVVFHTPYKKIIISSNKPIAYHINRPLLEEKLADRIESIGHELVYGVRVRPGLEPGSLRAGERSLHFQKIIASEGPYSTLREQCFGQIKNKIYGIQAFVKTSVNNTRSFQIIYDSFSQGFFGWIVPINEEKILIGYGARKHIIHPRKAIEYLAKKAGINKYKLEKFFGGTIPMDPPLKMPICRGKIFFIGDSIPLTKPYTGGGLYGITLLAEPLGKLLDGEITLRNYLEIYHRYYSRFVLQHRLVSVIRKIGYWLPVFFIEDLFRLKMFKEYQFDEHEKIFYRSMMIFPYTLPKLLFSTLRTSFNSF